MEDCQFEYPPIPPPNVVCWHPASDDTWTCWGIGLTREQAYRAMLINLSYSDLWDPHGDIERDLAGIDPDEGLPVARGRRRSAF